MTKASAAIQWRVIVTVGVVLAVILAVRTPDVGGENIGNWFFAKLFLDHPAFVVFPRAPLYQLYLVPFSLLPHPFSIVLERAATAFLCFVPVAALMCAVFDPRVGLPAAVLAAPDLIIVDPQAQALAFAACCLALFIRLRTPAGDGPWTSLSYALLLVAWLLRSNFMLIFLTVAAWDAIVFLRRRDWPSLRRFLAPRCQWPLLAVLLFVAVAAADQSPHRWNNYQMIDETWLPMKGQFASVISINVANNYRERVPDLGGLPFDIYFIHKKMFGDSKTIGDMIRTSPGEMVRHVTRNFRAYLTTAVSMTALGQSLFAFTTFGRRSFDETPGPAAPMDHRFVTVPVALALGVLFLYMAWRMAAAPARRQVLVFLVGFIVTASVAALLTKGDSPRFVFMLYGVFMVMAAFYAETALRAATRRRAIPVAAAALALLLLTQGGWARADARTGWAGVTWSVAATATPGSGGLFYAGKNDPLFKILDTAWPRCRGLVTSEMPQFVGAFSRFPPARLYSPFEIPPFGRLGKSDYAGLRRDRVNCVYAPHHVMKPGPGAITNIKLRYDSYIGPYMRGLIADGAEKIVLPSGVLVIAN